MNNIVIKTTNLTVQYGKKRGISGINLSVHKGEVFGFLGPNGAGKTTTMRVLLDIIRPTSGEASIFGLDCKKQGIEIRRKVWYLPGEFSPYSRMTGQEFLFLFASLKENEVNHSSVLELCERLDLDPSRKMKQYSHGNKQKVGIITAFMGKPELLILDEPTIGLDPIAQRTVLELVRETRDDGRTVLFSSHIMPEVQSICDRVGIIKDGHLIQTESVESLIGQQIKRIHLTLTKAPPLDAFDIEGVRETRRDGHTVSLDVLNKLDDVLVIALRYGIEDIETSQVTLEEIFVTLYNQTSREEIDA